MFIFKKYLNHIKRTAWNTYRELQRVEQEKALADAMITGYKSMTAKMEKEIEYYKNMYEREVKKNEALEKDVSFEHRNYYRVRVLPPCVGQRLP